MIAVGSQLGPYQVLASLGAGGMGEVWRARDSRLDRDVAVKVLPPQFAGDADRLARFEREAKAVAALSHPNILAIHDYGTDHGVCYAVMELLEGETLRGRLADGPLPWRKAVEVGAAVADGLAAAHAKGIVHRDIKPENLFVTTDDRVKVLDFGLARVEAPLSPEAETLSHVPALTAPGVVMGTISYMSPEQARGRVIDARSDLFSLGCVLYEMVAGRRPFAGRTSGDVIAAILHEEPPELGGSVRNIPDEAARVIGHCLEKKPECRFQSARDLSFALRALLTDSARAQLPAVPAPAGVGPAGEGQAGFPTKTQPVPPKTTSRSSWFWRIGLLVAVLFLAGVATKNWPEWFPWRPDRQPDPQARSLQTLAVLPFESSKNDPQAESLGDGVADHLISSLGRLRDRDLKIRSLMSAAPYKGKAIRVQVIGQELNVQAVVTGKLELAGDDLAITVQLVDAREDDTLWSKRYQGKRGDVLALQDAISKDVAARLGLKLTGEEEERLTKRPTENSEAYFLYREGRYHWFRFTEEGSKQAIDCFERALQIDGRFALAYAGLADSYVFLGANYWPPRQAFPRAREYARKAREMDDSRAEVHATLAIVAVVADWDWQKADDELQRTLALDPECAGFHGIHSYYLTALGRLDEALKAKQRAKALNPRSPSESGDLAAMFLFRREYDRAIAEAIHTLSLDPRYYRGHVYLGMAHAHKKMYGDAVHALEKAADLAKDDMNILGNLGYVCGRAGRRAEALRVLDQLNGQAKSRYVPPTAMAHVYLGLDDKEQALAHLRRAYEERWPWLMFLNSDPIYDPLRSDARFTQLLRDIGLPVPAAKLESPLDTVAVLPFENQSTDAEAGYLGDDITFSLTESLGRFRDLKVRSFSSASRYKKGDKTAVQAGRELQARAVLTGTIQKRGDEVVIFVELVDVREDQPLWKQRYAGKFAERLALHREIVRDLPEQLRLTLTGAQMRELVKPSTNSLKAHEFYVRGRIEWNKRTAAALGKALECFQRAVEADPEYALAHAGVADAYAVGIGLGTFSLSEAAPRIKTALDQALRLDDQLAEAHVILGYYKQHNDLDWSGAEAAYKRAIALKPHYATGHQWYALCLAYLRRFDQALAEARLAETLDPASPKLGGTVAYVLLLAGKPDEARLQLERRLQSAPEFARLHATLASVYSLQGKHSEGVRAMERAYELDRNPRALCFLGYLLAKADRAAEGRRILGEVRNRSGQQPVDPADLAMIHAALGEKDQALHLLEEAYTARSDTMPSLQVEPVWDSLRSEPRFQALVKKMNFPP